MTRLMAPRGTRDLLGEEVRAFGRVEEHARGRLLAYGYDEIRTPVFETADLFSRAVGETTDIVEKEMYVFEDRGGRPLSLRPEGTAGVVRAYLEHGWDQSSPAKKLFYVGPMFRAERPQAGRYREFWQLGAECFGNPAPQADAEMLVLVRDILDAVGLKNDVSFKVNSIGCPACRPVYRDALKAFLLARQDRLCENCRRRMDRNPLRALDCKGDGPQLTDAPLIRDHLCGACTTHRDEVYGLLTATSFPFEETPRLVRGLDYYSRTVFEVTAPGLGAQDALGAGGRYDGLVKLLGGPDTPAVGFALGLDRVVRALEARGAGGPVVPKIFVAQAGAGTGPVAFSIAKDLRERARGGCFAVDMGGPTKSLKAQLRSADGWGAAVVLLVGEEELKNQTVVVKDLKAHTQEPVALGAVVPKILAMIGVETHS